MKTHRRASYVAMHARTVPVEGSQRALRTDSRARTTGGILILALALGSLGADAVESSAHGSTGHASGHRAAGNTRLTAISARPLSARPWMY